MSVSAVFLDRDGTIIEDVGYVDDPEKVRLLPRAAEAIRRFAEAGHLVVIISNQSGIARGLFDEKTLARVHNQIETLLRDEDARVDGAYYCPYLSGDEARIDAFRRDSALRKPKPGMLLQAAEELGIDLSQSWMIGDSLCDVQAGLAAGCAAVLIDNGQGNEWADVVPSETTVVGSLWEAANVVLADQSNQKQAEPKRQTPVPRDSFDKGTVNHRSGDSRDEVVRLLGGIHDQIERAQRQRRQPDFSVLRLFGALLQMFAIVAGAWGTLALLNDQNTGATGRLVLACFFQLASLSAFAIDRFR